MCYLFSRHSRNLGNFFRSITWQNSFLQFLPALYIAGNKIFIGQSIPLNNMEHPQGQCAIRTRLYTDKFICPLGGFGGIGINANNLCTTLAGNIHIMLEMNICSEHADAPKHNIIAVLRFLRCCGQGLAHQRAIAMRLGRCTNRPVKTGGTQSKKQGMTGTILNRSHRSGIGIGQNRLATIRRHDFLPTGGNGVHGFLPADGDKFPLALRSYPF